MNPHEKSQWNEKWQRQLDLAILELVEKAQQQEQLELEIEAIRAFMELIASQITETPPE
jgi:predicted RecB family endonuclease